MNLAPEQQILIKDIFAVTVNPDDHSSFYLRSFASEIAKFGQNASLVEHSTYFDSLLMERLQAPQTQILAYLQECWLRAEQAKDKPWNSNQEAADFISYSLEIIKNFINLALQESDLFSEQLEIQPNASKAANKTVEISMKLMTHFERRGYNLNLLEIVKNELAEEFYEQFLQVLLARQRFQTILQPKALLYISLLNDLLAIPQFRSRFIKLKNWNFLPKEIEKIEGKMIDIQSPFGVFAKLSVLGQNAGFYHQQNEAVLRFEERMIAQLGNERLSKQKLKFYKNSQKQFYNKLTETYKLLLKKQTKNQFIEWNYALLISNIGRTKLGSNLYNANNSSHSHDGILINAYAALLNISKVIIARKDDKYLSISPDYFKYNSRLNHLKYDSLNSKQPKKIFQTREFGTITQFFFLSIQLLHVGVCSALDNFVEYNSIKKNYEKEALKMQASHPMYKKFQYQMSKIQSKIVRYFVILFQEQDMINETIKLLDTLIVLFLEWIKLPEMEYYLPEIFLTIICKYHNTNFQYKQNYLAFIREDQLHQILNLTCFLLSQQHKITNPYISANYIELLFMFLHDNKPNVILEVFKSNQNALQQLTLGLIKFYCSIALTGRSHQFYEKFKYRFFANKIFSTLWTLEAYRQDLKNYFHTPLFQKFLNMVLTDTTYCFDETNENYEKYKQLEAKKLEGPLSEEDLKNEEQVEGIIRSTLNQSTSNLRLMRDLSAWSPQTFLTQADRKTAVPLLNNILKTFVDPGAFTANRQLLLKFKFERGPALGDLLQMYTNIDINDILSSQIVKDGRNYRKEYFSKALQRASNEHFTSIDILQKFESLIYKLSTVQQEQDEQIYGEIPQKYLCELMSTLMKDPVKLPSGHILDRVTIHRHLLTDERDPFTRNPLKESELILLSELKEQIEVWKKKRWEQLKKGDKEIKYGKGSVNKKEQKESVFGNNPVIEQE